MRTVTRALARPDEMSVVAGWQDERLGRALMFRSWPARLLHVEGDSPLAAEFRRPLCQFRLQSLAAALPDDVPQPARKLLEELEERRRLILTRRDACGTRPTWPPRSVTSGRSSASWALARTT